MVRDLVRFFTLIFIISGPNVIKCGMFPTHSFRGLISRFFLGFTKVTTQSGFSVFRGGGAKSKQFLLFETKMLVFDPIFLSIHIV